MTSLPDKFTVLKPAAVVRAYDVPNVEMAREAVDRLRDFARDHGMHAFERDPLVLIIQCVLDAAEPLLSERPLGTLHEDD